MAIGHLHHLVFDAAEPARAAAFWSAVLGLPVTHDDPAWTVVARDTTTSGLAFQLAPDHVPPDRADPARPQQTHVDVMVDDLAVAAAAVRALGAVQLPGDHIFADPAGHPFCLIMRPGWAPPIG